MKRIVSIVLAALAIAAAPPAAAQQAAAQQAAAAPSSATANPHGSLKEPCADSHTANGWKPTKITKAFKHVPKVFPLDGAHAQTNCLACHKSLDFAGTPSKCAVCHKDIHQGELGADCARCHSPRSFIDRSVMVQQHQTTRFPLTGAHVTTDCLSCHPPVLQGHMTFVGRQVQCVACHLPAYQSTTNPPHVANGFPTTCDACHSTVAWAMAAFNHATTGFALTGAHAAIQCSACHANNVFTKLNTDCYSCHQPDYSATNNPPHVASGFPTTCTTCHTTVNWNSTFDHSKTPFPLTGAHLAVACTQCHKNGVYAGLSTTCYSCHQTDFTTSNDPTHTAANFSTSCATCHTTVSWAGVAYNHSTTGWPLTGAHIPLDCNACHGDNVFHGKSTLCYACHVNDYNGTNNPGHAAAGFPTACDQCHTTTTWAGATFNHDQSWFPIYSGRHAGVWSTCATCHINAANYAQFSCTNGCHSANSTTPNHNGVSGYTYTPTSCYSCHPRG